MKRLRRAVMASILAIMTVVVVMFGFSTAASAGTVTVSARSGWQSTGYHFNAGDTFTVSASGSWTVDYRNYDYVEPGGYGSIDSSIFAGCRLVQSAYGDLLGMIGNIGPFRIGTGGTFRTPQSGTLYLRINDQNQCLGDNAGYVTANIN